MPPLLSSLSSFLSRTTRPGDGLLVAFSGGPDSTALLWSLRQVSPRLGLEVRAAHLDHGLDPDSKRRARAAAELAAHLATPLTVERLSPTAGGTGSESLEAYARRQRYRFLGQVADGYGLRWIATAHHAEDQVETVLLRILFGSGIEGLGAIAKRRGRLLRPLIEHSRDDLLHAVARAGLKPVTDPTNSDAGLTRNRIRASLIPYLETREPGIARRLDRLAGAARRVRHRLERRLPSVLALHSLRCATTGKALGSAIDRPAFDALPAPLQPFALTLLHRRAGVPYPASSAARSELLRQAHAGGAIGCDCGLGWRWEGDAESLRLVESASSCGEFAYTLDAPGSVDVPELALRVHLRRGPISPWMFRGRASQAGLASIDLGTRQVVVRNRRAGDRIQPLGCDGSQRLKDLMINHRIPRRGRDRLPLLVIDQQVVWVPGITIDERYRLDGGPTAWIAEIERLVSDKDNSPTSGIPLADGGSTER